MKTGRAPKFTPDQEQRMRRCQEQGMAQTAIAQRFGCSLGLVKRVLSGAHVGMLRREAGT